MITIVAPHDHDAAGQSNSPCFEEGMSMVYVLPVEFAEAGGRPPHLRAAFEYVAQQTFTSNNPAKISLEPAILYERFSAMTAGTQSSCYGGSAMDRKAQSGRPQWQGRGICWRVCVSGRMRDLI
jgi:hypothetical protein